MRTSRTATFALPILFALTGAAASAQELPPEIRMDRYMVQVDRQIGSEQYTAALRTLDRILELRSEHGLALPESFWMKRAEVALGVEDYLEAIRVPVCSGGIRGDFRGVGRVCERWGVRGIPS